MASIFKIKKDPILGYDLTNSNTLYISSLNGSSSNSGTITSPYVKLSDMGYTVSKYIMLRGIFSENFTIPYGNMLIGDNNAVFTGNVVVGNNSSVRPYAYNIVFLGNTSGAGCRFYNCYIKNHTDNTPFAGFPNENGSPHMINCIVENYNSTSHGYSTTSALFNIVSNSIIINSIDLYNYTSRSTIANIPIFKNCMFLKTTQFKWNGTIITISYGSNPSNYLSELISSLTTYANAMSAGTDKTYLLYMIANSFANTNIVYDDSGQTLFNRYYGGQPIDYTLKIGANPALSASDTQGYIGAYMAGLPRPSYTIYDVDSNGVNTANTPDLFMANSDGSFYANPSATQIRNRIEFDVENFPRGYSFLGFQSSFKSGLSSRLSLGKKLSIASDTLPQETIEILPYDNATTPSVVYPKFSANLNGTTEMYYLVSQNRPLLFNDLSSIGISTDKNLTEYGTWGVTTADYETFLLSSLSTVTSKKINIFWFKKQLNIHYYAS